MAEKLSVICSASTDPYYNLALEEYLLGKVCEDEVILYLWQNDHTVVIGRNQNPWAECRTALLLQEQGHLARRLSGGGAVYHDLGNLNFTFLCREHHYNVQKQLSVIQRAAAFAGIDASFSGRNDLLADGRKFSGNAFYHSKGHCYHHGTLLICTDVERMQRYLSPPKAKLESKGVSSVRSRVVNLQSLSPTLTCERMKQFMSQAFGEIYGEEVRPLTLQAEALTTILELRCNYDNENWLYGRPFPFTCSIEGRLSFGSVQLHLQVKNGIIEDLQVFTDAMDDQLAPVLCKALRGCPLHAEALKRACRDLSYCDDLCTLFAQQIL